MGLEVRILSWALDCGRGEIGQTRGPQKAMPKGFRVRAPATTLGSD